MANLDEIGEDFILCNICNNEYDDDKRAPKLLPCLHTVCSVCIRSCISGAILKCPTCAEPHQRQQFVELMKDCTMKNMVDMIRLQKKSTSIPCSDCPDGNQGSTFCSDCSEFLCNECTAAHKRTQITRQHSLVSIDDMKASGIEIFNKKELCLLPNHDNHPFSFYCDKMDCQKPICMQCVVTEHTQAKGHSVRNLMEVYDEARTSVEQMVGELLTKLSSVCSKMKILESEETHLGSKYDAITGQIDSLFDKMEAQLRDRRSNLKQEVETVLGRRKDEVTEQRRSLQKAKTDLENSCNYSSRMLAFTNMAEFLQLKSMVHERLKRLLEQEGVGATAVKVADLQLSEGKQGQTFQDYINSISITQSGTGSAIKAPENTPKSTSPAGPKLNGVGGGPVMAKQSFHITGIQNRQTSVEAPKPALSEKPAFNGNMTLPIQSSSSPFVPVKASHYRGFNTKSPVVERLQLDGINDDAIGPATKLATPNSSSKPTNNNNNSTSLLSLRKPKPFEIKQPLPVSAKAESPLKSPSDNVLGRPLSLKSPVISTTKKPTSLGDFLNELHIQSREVLDEKRRLWKLDDFDFLLEANDDVVPVVPPEPTIVPSPSSPVVKHEPVTRDSFVPSSSSLSLPASSRFRTGALQLKTTTTPTTPTKTAQLKSPILTESSYANAKQSPTTPKSPPSDKPVAFGDITCPEFHLDISSAHPEREVSTDGRTLRNKKTDIFTSNSGMDIDNHLVQYKGAIGTFPFKEPGRYYYEVDVMYNIQQPLEETWLVFEIGVCPLDDVDMHHTVERHQNARSFYVARYPENGMLAQEFWHNRDLLGYSILSENTAGLEVHVTYGFLVDTRRKKWIVVDSGNNKVLHTFDMLDFSEALYPVLGCYNPDLITVEMTLKSGSELKVIPQCLKAGYR